MKITLDKSVDAAYIYLTPLPGNYQVADTYTVDHDETNGMINLDFDSDGRLLGIEVLEASKCLPQELLSIATITNPGPEKMNGDGGLLSLQ